MLLDTLRMMVALGRRLAHARRAHPDGATLAALLEEVDEVLAEAPGTARERDELLDVATVAIRLWLGEEDRR